MPAWATSGWDEKQLRGPTLWPLYTKARATGLSACPCWPYGLSLDALCLDLAKLCLETNNQTCACSHAGNDGATLCSQTPTLDWDSLLPCGGCRHWDRPLNVICNALAVAGPLHLRVALSIIAPGAPRCNGKAGVLLP